MRKTGAILVLALWAAAGVHLLAGKVSTEEEKIIEVIESTGLQQERGVVEYYGVYEDGVLEMSEAEELLRGTAEELGIRENVTVRRSYGGEREEVRLSKKGNQTETTLRFITIEESGEITQYVLAKISIQGDVESVIGYRSKLEGILSPVMRNSKSPTNIVCSQKGKMSITERNALADRMLREMNAKVVSEIRNMRFYTIYAYTPFIHEYIERSGNAVNLNIAMYYSPGKDTTFIYTAVPVAGLDCP